MITSGTLTNGTNEPAIIASPPNSSVRAVTQAVKCGAGTLNAWSMSANPSTPRLNFANPWAAKPKPMIRRSGSKANPDHDLLFCKFNIVLSGFVKRSEEAGSLTLTFSQVSAKTLSTKIESRYSTNLFRHAEPAASVRKADNTTTVKNWCKMIEPACLALV
jgi:hypothetical protein